MGCKRKATVVADTKTSLYKMNAPDFRIMPAFILQGLRKEAQMRETFEDKRSYYLVMELCARSAERPSRLYCSAESRGVETA